MYIPLWHQQHHWCVLQIMHEALAAEPSTLFLMAAYHIGKERAFIQAAKALQCKVSW